MVRTILSSLVCRWRDTVGITIPAAKCMDSWIDYGLYCLKNFAIRPVTNRLSQTCHNDRVCITICHVNKFILARANFFAANVCSHKHYLSVILFKQPRYAHRTASIQYRVDYQRFLLAGLACAVSGNSRYGNKSKNDSNLLCAVE